MKFKLGEKVRVKSSNKVGTVESYKELTTFINGELIVSKKYEVKTAPLYSFWYDEDNVEWLYVFDKNFEIGLLNVMIDVSLDQRNFELVKYYQKMKQKYLD